MAEFEPAYKTALKKHHNALRVNIIVANFLPALRTVLTDVEYIRIEDKGSRIDSVDELVKVLLTKDYSTFDSFCSALEENGSSYWASLLKENGAEHVSQPNASLETMTSSRKHSTAFNITPDVDHPVHLLCSQSQTDSTPISTTQQATAALVTNGHTLDVLLLGFCGIGKSTTGNKLLYLDGISATDQVTKGALTKVWPRISGRRKQGSDCSGCIWFDTMTRESSEINECSVVANNETGFRVMDTKGFVAYNAMKNQQIMIDVQKISTQLNIAFHRVLYFLPQRDIPEKADGQLQEELAALWHVYADDIFRKMVIVVTAPPRLTSTIPDIDSQFYSGATTQAQQVFLTALKAAINGFEGAKLPPCPDIVFIPFRATSEFVTKLVKTARVHEPNGIS